MKIKLLALLSALLLGASTVNSQVLCGREEFCLYATNHDNGTTEFTLQTYKPNLGWIGFGLGFDMFHAQIFVAWVNDGNVTLSKRQSFKEGEPLVDLEPLYDDNFEITSSSYSSLTDTFTVSFLRDSEVPDLSFSIIPGSNNDMIWSFSYSKPDSSLPDAKLQMHTHRGPFTANFFTETTSYASMLTNGITIPSSIPRFSLFTLHGILMFTAWLVLAPLGIILTRLLRPFHPEFMAKVHAVTMITVLGLTLAGVGTALVVKHGNILINTTPTAAIHVSVGFVIMISCCVQAGLGIYIRSTSWVAIPGFWNKIHGLNGKALLTLAVGNIPLGMFVYNSRVFVFSGFWYVGIVCWMVFLVLAFVEIHKFMHTGKAPLGIQSILSLSKEQIKFGSMDIEKEQKVAVKLGSMDIEAAEERNMEADFA